MQVGSMRGSVLGEVVLCGVDGVSAVRSSLLGDHHRLLDAGQLVA